jgi:hypothetical protein
MLYLQILLQKCGFKVIIINIKKYHMTPLSELFFKIMAVWWKCKEIIEKGNNFGEITYNRANNQIIHACKS